MARAALCMVSKYKKFKEIKNILFGDPFFEYNIFKADLATKLFHLLF